MVLDNNTNLLNLFEYSFCQGSKIALLPKLLMKNPEELKRGSGGAALHH